MEIIHVLRRWKAAWLNYKDAKKYNSVKALRALLQQHPHLKSITIEREALVLGLNDDVRFEWKINNRGDYLLAINEQFEVFERYVIKNILFEGDCVFDIGANFGYFTVYMKRFCPSLDLYAFEPIKSTYATLLRNLTYNDLQDVKTYNHGFSNENGDVVFNIPEQLGGAWASMGTGVSSVYNYKINQELASVRKLDDFVTQQHIDKIDFIKCDVEGAEKLIIEGGMETIKRDWPTFMLEIGNLWTASFGYNREILISLMMNDLNYRCFGVLGNQALELRVANDVNKHSEDKMYNYFFVHPSRSDVMNLILNCIKTS